MASEITVAIIGLAGAVVGGGLTSMTTWLIARSERTKFSRERIWDLRREAYMKIMASIIPATRLAEHMKDEYEADPHGYDAGDDVRRATSQYVGHVQAAREAFYINRLVLSEAFAVEFEKLMLDLADINSNPNLLPPELARLTWEQLRPASFALVQLALDEINSGLRTRLNRP